MRRLVEHPPPDPRTLLGALRRPIEVFGGGTAKVVPLVERPFSHGAHHRDAIEGVLDTEGVVVDIRVLRAYILVPRGRWLDLELLPHVVLHADARACDRIPPHLEHPSEGAVRGVVVLELD